MSTIGFIAQAFCCMPLGTAKEMGFVASDATREAMRDSTGDGGGAVSFFCSFEVEAATLAFALDLFLDDAPPRSSQS